MVTFVALWALFLQQYGFTGAENTSADHWHSLEYEVGNSFYSASKYLLKLLHNILIIWLNCVYIYENLQFIYDLLLQV